MIGTKPHVTCYHINFTHLYNHDQIDLDDIIVNLKGLPGNSVVLHREHLCYGYSQCHFLLY